MVPRRRRVGLGVSVTFVALSAIGQVPMQVQQEQKLTERDASITLSAPLIKRLYASMTHLTYPERASLLSTYRTPVQMALWQYHFDEFERLNPQLTATQRQFLADSRALMQNAALFSIQEGDDGWEQKHQQILGVVARGRAAFSARDFLQGFVRLGPPYVPRYGLPDVPVVGTANCLCSTEYNCGEADEECMRGDDIFACTPTSWGCGPFGFYGCNGFCF